MNRLLKFQPGGGVCKDNKGVIVPCTPGGEYHPLTNRNGYTVYNKLPISADAGPTIGNAKRNDLKSIKKVYPEYDKYKVTQHPDYDPNKSVEDQIDLNDDHSLRTTLLRGRNLTMNEDLGGVTNFLRDVMYAPGSSFANLMVDPEKQYIQPGIKEGAINLATDVVNVAPTRVFNGMGMLAKKFPTFIKHGLQAGSQVIGGLNSRGLDGKMPIARYDNTLPLELFNRDMDSSFAGRKQLATELGMNNYTSDNDNEELITKMQEYQNNNNKQLGGNILKNNNMNMNFFMPRKNLRTFQKGGAKPQLGPDDSPEEYAMRLAQWQADNTIETIPPIMSSMPSVTGAPIAAPELPNVTTMMQPQVKSDYQGSSIVDFLKSMGVDSSKANRRKLAALSGDDNYDMSGSDNQALMDYVRKNAQGKDKIRNANGDIVSIDGANQVPLTIKGLDNLNRTGSVIGKKQNSLRNSDDDVYAADATKRLAMYANNNTTFDATDPFILGRNISGNNINRESNVDINGRVIGGALGTGAAIAGAGMYGAGMFKGPNLSNIANTHTASSIATATNNVMRQNDLAALTNQLSKNNLNKMEIPASKVKALAKTDAGKALLLKLKNSPLMKNMKNTGVTMAESILNNLKKFKNVRG